MQHQKVLKECIYGRPFDCQVCADKRSCLIYYRLFPNTPNYGTPVKKYLVKRCAELHKQKVSILDISKELSITERDVYAMLEMVKR